MKSLKDFMPVVDFLKTPKKILPGDFEYNAAFCKTLVQAASAAEASIWQMDKMAQLHLIHGTNVSSDELADVTLRVGEGITGAAALSHKIIIINDVYHHSGHDRRVDDRINFKTYSMISTPVIFEGFLFGVINIVNSKNSSGFSGQLKGPLTAISTLYAAALASVRRLKLYKISTSTVNSELVSNKTVLNTERVIVGVSKPLREAMHLCFKAGRTDLPVLIRGETGTGKELAALRLHEVSQCANGPFLAVNCSALAETLLESELFGHVKGSFSGAVSNRKGKFNAASGGTLFLDEIGDMSLSFQTKILRTLQNNRITPVGSEKSIDCNIRIVSATNQDLWTKVQRGDFREDLFYRLCSIEIIMPPLRERKEDIPLLITYFLNRFCLEHQSSHIGKKTMKMSHNALNILENLNWQGNVRQLEQAVFASAAVCEGDNIEPDDFPVWLKKSIKKEKKTALSNSEIKEHYFGKLSRSSILEDDQRYLEALDRTKYPGTRRWNLSKASRELGIARKTLWYRLKKKGLI